MTRVGSQRHRKEKSNNYKPNCW